MLPITKGDDFTPYPFVYPLTPKGHTLPLHLILYPYAPLVHGYEKVPFGDLPYSEAKETKGHRR